MNSNSTELEQVIRTHRTSCPSGWPRGLVELNPGSPQPEYLPVSIRSSPLLYLFTFATVRIPVRAKCARGSASLYHRNRAELTVLVCEQKLYPVRFLCLHKSHAVECEQLALIMVIYLWFDNEAFRDLQII